MSLAAGHSKVLCCRKKKKKKKKKKRSNKQARKIKEAKTRAANSEKGNSVTQILKLFCHFLLPLPCPTIMLS